MIVLGIDPGTVVTGYACLELKAGRFHTHDLGVIRPPKGDLLSQRYHAIYQSIVSLMRKFNPKEIAVETPFIQKNAQSALKLGGALGCIMIAACECNVPIYGYSPREVKCGIFGTGAATKEEIQAYLCRLLSLDMNAMTYLDATDALAIAIHHADQKRKDFSNTLSAHKSL